MLSPASVPIEVWLSIGYGLAMVGLAYVVDGFARRTAATNEGGRLSGFTYHEDLDAWTCREGQWLRAAAFDPQTRVMRYRGDADTCNACPAKHTCTTSNVGREVVRSVESWPASEAARFHRRIACTTVVLGLIWPIALMFSSPGATGLLVLVIGVLGAAALSLPLWSHLWRAKTYIPEAMLLTASPDDAEPPSRHDLQVARASTDGKDTR